MENEYHEITDIIQPNDQWWPVPQRILIRGSLEDAEKHAKDQGFSFYKITQMKIENNKFVKK